MGPENEVGAPTQQTIQLREQLQEALELFRRELALTRWAEARSYRHLEALVQDLLDRTYFSPFHLFVEMPDERTALSVTLDRLRQVTWIMSGRLPTADFKPRFHVRPYHPAYFIVWHEQDLAVDEQSRLDDVVTRLKAHPELEVEIVRGLDDVCAACLFTDIYRCLKDADNQRHWDGVNDRLLAKQGLAYGQRLSVRDLMLNAAQALPTWEDTEGVCPSEKAEIYQLGRRYWRALLSDT